MVTEVVLVQPPASFTVIVYAPAASPENTLPGWKVVPSMLYCRTPLPPDAATVIEPFPPLHKIDEAVAATEIAGGSVMVTGTLMLQLLASFMVKT